MEDFFNKRLVEEEDACDAFDAKGYHEDDEVPESQDEIDAYEEEMDLATWDD